MSASKLAARIDEMQTVDRTVAGMSITDAKRSFDTLSHGSQVVNLTHADLKRYPPPRGALFAFAAAASGAINVFTPYLGDPAVRADLAVRLSTLLNVPVDAALHLGLVPGTQAGLFSSLAATIDPGNRVAVLDPDYMCLEPILRFCGAQIVHIALDHTADGTAIDFDGLRAFASTGGRALVFTNPNNPTGAVVDLQALSEIAAICVEHDLLAVVDELYCRCLFDDVAFHHLVSLPEMRERTITLMGPSKTEQMSGYRVGVVVAPEPVLQGIADVLSVTAIRAPTYSQYALCGWLGEDEAYVTTRLAEYSRVRRVAYDALSAISAVDVTLPQATPYIFPSVQRLGRNDLEVARLLLTEADVVTTPGYEFGPRGAGSFRICFAQDEAVLCAALERISTTLSDLAGASI